MKSLLKIFNTNPERYSSEWFKSLSDKQLDVEREKVRKQTQDPNWNGKLRAFDYEIVRRYEIAHPEEKRVQPRHREHGYNLYKR